MVYHRDVWNVDDVVLTPTPLPGQRGPLGALGLVHRWRGRAASPGGARAGPGPALLAPPPHPWSSAAWRRARLRGLLLHHAPRLPPRLNDGKGALAPGTWDRVYRYASRDRAHHLS